MLREALEEVRLDPYRERSRRCLMRAFAASGSRANAVAAYHELNRVLSQDLGTEPEPETQALYLELLDQELLD